MPLDRFNPDSNGATFRIKRQRFPFDLTVAIPCGRESVANVSNDPAPVGDAEQRIIDLIKRHTTPRALAPDAEPATSPADLRDCLIAEQHRAGVDAATIAQTMNLRRSAVDRVVSQLTGNDGQGQLGEVG